MAATFPKNWCNLPAEMKSECIERMNFQSRMRLRATASEEKLLVETAPKCHMFSVHIDLDVISELRPLSVIYMENDEQRTVVQRNPLVEVPEFVRNAHRLISQILKFADVANFDFRADYDQVDHVPEFVSVISGSAPFRFSRLILLTSSYEIVTAFLENFENPQCVLLEISVRRLTEAQQLGLVAMEAIFRANLVRLLHLPDVEPPVQLIQKWIERDADIGKTLQCSILDIDCMDDFERLLDRRVVDRVTSVVRIRTNNDAKHILIRATDDPPSFVVISVIPAAHQEPEGRRDDRWAFEYQYNEVRRRYNAMRNERAGRI